MNNCARVVYLTDVEQGSAASFPALGITVFPKKGGAVFFANVDPHGIPHRKTLHPGTPMEKGIKVTANKWLRSRPYGWDRTDTNALHYKFGDIQKQTGYM